MFANMTEAEIKEFKHVKRVKERWNGMSPLCKATTESVICSQCDGDIGIHKKKGLCEDLCDSWFTMCAGDFIVPINEDERSSPNSEVWLDFMENDFSNVEKARTATKYVTNSRDFCKGMGFPVNDNFPYCFSGVPAAKTLKLNQKKSGWKKDKNQATIHKSPKDSISMLMGNVYLLGYALFFFTIVISLLYGVYLFNIWQINLDVKEKQMKERQRRIDAVKEKRAVRRAERAKIEEEMKEIIITMKE